MEVLNLPATPQSSAIFSILRRHAAIRLGILTLLAFFFEIPSVLAQTRRPEEVKAAFLYNFARFVEWPAKAFEGPASPFVIGIAGDEDIAAELQAMVKGEKVGNRPFQIRSCRRPRDGEGCHLLYVGGRVKADEFLDVAKNDPVLTVGDATDFLRHGGIVQFLTERTVRLRIDLRNARRASLTISSQLLRLAEIENQ